jgi:nitroimidazol reductase NimA-like FMN-containing flavoprotein (pyridoxamine 5'-phosphate oxidase superfamily)
MIPDRVKKGSVSVLDRLKKLDRQQFHAVLATDANGQPYTSMIAFALFPGGREIVFASPRGTAKYKNMLKNKRVSLLIDTRSNTRKDYMKAESLTVIGFAHSIRRGKRWDEAARVLIKKHPALRRIMGSSETKLIFVEIRRCVHVTRFQTVSEWIAE